MEAFEIIFIIDESVKNEENKLFFYTNPNAKNKMYEMLKDGIKNILHPKYDWSIIKIILLQ